MPAHQVLPADRDHRDRSAAADRLAAAVLEVVGARDAEELLAWAYDPAGGVGAGAWAPVAALAPLAEGLAAEGDEAAREVLDGAARELCGSIGSVTRRLGLGGDGRTFPVVLAGGLMRKGGPLGDAVACRLADEHRGAEVVFPTVEPAEGAALLARALLD